MKKNSKLIVITGATASGKTELAINLADKIGAEIISADSRIVFKDMDIVTAKPSFEEMRGIKHHLIDIKKPSDGLYSAGEWVQSAKEIIKNSDCPIIIQGGTWFYIKSLFDEKDLIEFGKNDELRKHLSKFSNDELWEMLNKKDSKRASLVHKNNRDKVIRSIELIEALGEKLSDYKRKENEKLDSIWFMPDIERGELYKRIDIRVDSMIKKGLYFEWEKNYKKYGRNEVVYNTIGYKEFFDLEDGIYKSKEEATEKIKQHTRNFAKRQLTWFRQNEKVMKITPVSSLQHVTKLISI